MGRARGGGNSEPLSWPELYGLVITATGLSPREVDAMYLDDIADLGAHWKRWPPAHIAVERLRRIVMWALDPEAAASDAPAPPPPRTLPTEDEVRGWVAQINGAA